MTPAKLSAAVAQLSWYEAQGVLEQFQFTVGETYALLQFTPGLGVKPSMVAISGLDVSTLRVVSC